MTQPTDHRRAIENALRSLAIEQYAAQLILDNFDCAVKAARKEGYETCADHILAAAQNLKGYGQA
jgi:hypothetical protein